MRAWGASPTHEMVAMAGEGGGGAAVVLDFLDVKRFHTVLKPLTISAVATTACVAPLWSAC